MGSGGGACDCCGATPSDDAPRADAPPPTSALSSSRSMGGSLRSLLSVKNIPVQSLRSLSMTADGGAGAGEPRDEDASVEDDPATHYSHAKKPRDKAAAMGGMYVQPKHTEKFDPQRFKKRVGDHLAAEAALIAKAEEESAPLLSGGDVGYAASDDARETKREMKRKKKEQKFIEKDGKKQLKYAVQRERDYQRQMWRALVTITLVVVVLAGIIFSGDMDFKFGVHSKNDRAKDDDVVRTRSHGDDSMVVTMTEPARGAYSATEARDEEDVDILDPTSRTWSPKEWKRHDDEMRKIKHRARANAKADVLEFVKSAHSELGMDDDVDEYETNDADDDADGGRKSSHASAHVMDSDDDDDDSVENILAASEASVLSHSLIVDAVNSTRAFTSKAKPTKDIAEALAAAVLESEGGARAPSVLMSTARASLPPPPPALELSNSTETPTTPVVVENVPKEGALTIPGITPPPVLADPTNASVQAHDARTSHSIIAQKGDKYGVGDLLNAEDDSVESLLAAPEPEVAPASTPRRALR